MQVYKFSSTIQPVNGPPVSAVQDARFYTGADTPLASLLTQIGSHADRTAIVVSDLVLSSRKEDPLGLVKAMAALGAQRPQIELLGFRSDFKGDYQSERTHENPYKIKVSQSAPGMGRPFYLIVVAPQCCFHAKGEERSAEPHTVWLRKV